MTCILALDTSTDTCSVALYRDGEVAARCEVLPRQHNRRILSMLEEILPGGKLREYGVEAIAYACGPGSFTGLRIAASAVQGLAFSQQLPVIPVSTLACLTQTALHTGVVQPGQLVLSVLDARVNEIYAGLYDTTTGLAQPLSEAVAVAPERLQLPSFSGQLVAVGSGAAYSSRFPMALRDRLAAINDQLQPRAEDILPLALAALSRGATQAPAEAIPVYVRDEINWKKIPEQGRRG